MTNLNKLIERWQREVRKKYQTREAEVRLGYFVDYIDISYEDLDTITTQTATEAYRQALEELLAGLPREQRVVEEELQRGGYASQSDIEAEQAWNTALQTVRAKIEELLANTNLT
jgi:hypothetical protein